jgi:hypothetical protein
MHPIFSLFILLPLVLSAPEITLFGGADLDASNFFLWPDAYGDTQSYLPLEINSNEDAFNPESLNGLDYGGWDPLFQPSEEQNQDQPAIDPYPEIFAGAEDQCSFDDFGPASKLRARGASCPEKQDAPVMDLLPPLDNLPGPNRKKLPSPSPVNPPAWAPFEQQDRNIMYNDPAIENPEICPFGWRGWYFIPVCGVRLGDQGKYRPTESNPLKGWTVTDASLCKLD